MHPALALTLSGAVSCNSCIGGIILKTRLENAIKDAQAKVDSCLKTFTFAFPGAQSSGYVYEPTAEFGWTEGFWTGILWIMYELTGNEEYRNAAEIQCGIFSIREEKGIKLDHHDLGFLYTLSCVAAYKITGDEKYKAIALKAADRLCLRWRSKGKFLQAWAMPVCLIIDTLLNIPLLRWASEVSGNPKYSGIAKAHLDTALETIIRDDFTTRHIYMFDAETEAPLHGIAGQAYSADSCWARGQAWAIAGLAISYSYTKDEKLIPFFNGVTEHFINNLPADYIPYWDLIFTSGNEPRDTSAAAIAICGILEMGKHIPNPKFEEAADKMLTSLMDNYTTRNLSFSNGLLTDGMYDRNRGHGSECNIWGDYFYLEAIIRKTKNWNRYW